MSEITSNDKCLDLLMQSKQLVHTSYEVTAIQNRIFYYCLLTAQKEKNGELSCTVKLEDLKKLIPNKNQRTLSNIKKTIQILKQTSLEFEKKEDGDTIECDYNLIAGSEYNVNKETLAERGKINTDSPKWDKIILTIYWLLTFFVIYLVAGLEMNKADKPGIIFAMGIILQIPVTIISLKAMMVNTFLESTSRVQFDRSQIVCKEGPYKIIRHPTYLAILIWCISISMIFETKLVLIISIIIAGLIVIRTYLEDKMLKEKLKGYEEYSHEVKYRLIPLIW